MTLTELAGMLEEKSAAMAVIMFTTGERITELTKNLTNTKVLNVQTDAAFLRSLDERAAPDKHWILLTEDASTLRGFDLRGHNKGLCLILDQGFESDRDAS